MHAAKNNSSGIRGQYEMIGRFETRKDTLFTSRWREFCPDFSTP